MQSRWSTKAALPSGKFEWSSNSIHFVLVDFPHSERGDAAPPRSQWRRSLKNALERSACAGSERFDHSAHEWFQHNGTHKTKFHTHRSATHVELS